MSDEEGEYFPIPEALYHADNVRRYQVRDHKVSDVVVFVNEQAESLFNHALVYIIRKPDHSEEPCAVLQSCSVHGIEDIEQEWRRSPPEGRGAGVDTMWNIGSHFHPDPVALVDLARERAGDATIPYPNPAAVARRLNPELFGDPNSMQVRSPVAGGPQT